MAQQLKKTKQLKKTNEDVTALWQARARRLLKAELKRREISYAELSRRLTNMGVDTSEAGIASKLSRGGFSAAFLLQCFEVAGVKTLRLSED